MVTMNERELSENSKLELTIIDLVRVQRVDVTQLGCCPHVLRASPFFIW